jgi:hypothetical protein
MKFRVQSSGFRVQGSEFRVQGSEFGGASSQDADEAEPRTRNPEP